MKRATLAAISVLLFGSTGCTGAELELEARWRPLERIAESSAWPEGIATTIGTTVWTRDLEVLLQSYPEGPERDGLLLHEREHAARQKASGSILSWVAEYATSPEFMWAEESRGWFLQLRLLQAHGRRVSAERTAAALSKYETIQGGRPMIGYADALKWVREVLSGRWKPPAE